VREQVDPDANRATMPWRNYFLAWISQMPETMNAKVFYRQWLKIERPHLISQPGEH
jgi:hypothetical protein